MKEELLKIYKTFSTDNLYIFFDKLISYVNNHVIVFSKYISLDYLEAIKVLNSKKLILGHSDDDFEIAIPFYVNQLKAGTSEEKICNQVAGLIWDLSAYMTDEVCPSCHDSNLRLTTKTNEINQIIKFCDECLYTGIDGVSIEIEEDLIPASKDLVESYLNMKQV